MIVWIQEKPDIQQHKYFSKLRSSLTRAKKTITPLAAGQPQQSEITVLKGYLNIEIFVKTFFPFG